MRSVADALRDETRRMVLEMNADARIELAFRLGEDDIALLRSARGCSDAEARRIFSLSRQAGRARSIANEDAG